MIRLGNGLNPRTPTEPRLLAGSRYRIDYGLIRTKPWAQFLSRRNKANKWRHAIRAALLSGRHVPSKNLVPLDTSDTLESAELQAAVAANS